MGYSRKYPPPPPPLWTTLNWVSRNFRISKKDSGSLWRIRDPADSNSLGITEFCKFLNVLLEFQSKFTKFQRNSWNSSQAHRAFITGFPMSSRGGDIFCHSQTTTYLYTEVTDRKLSLSHKMSFQTRLLCKICQWQSSLNLVSRQLKLC